MVTFLLIIIFIIFIGLGLPDSILGSAWPAIYKDLNIARSSQGFITIITSVGTALASYFSARLINKFGTGLVTLVSTLISALALLGFSFSNSLWFFLLMSIPLGIGAGAIDSALNNYVATRYKASQMNFLHAFYGVGVTASPFIISLALGGAGGWRQGYRIIFYLMMGIFAVSLCALPLWKKVNKKYAEQNFTPITIGIKTMIKMPAVRICWIVFFTTCALEFTCGAWGATYLVDSEGLSEELGAMFITFYYAGITLGRLVSGFIAVKVKPVNILFSGCFIVGVALVLLILPLPVWLKGASLLLIGFGNGPTFPNLTHLTPKFFGADISQSITGMNMVMCNLGICLAPPAFSLVAQYLNIKLFPLFLIAIFVVMVIFMFIYIKMPKQTSKDLNF